jgi:hypothetical protein
MDCQILRVKRGLLVKNGLVLAACNNQIRIMAKRTGKTGLHHEFLGAYDAYCRITFFTCAASMLRYVEKEADLILSRE